MTISKGTIQGFNGVATVDKKHQIVVDDQAFGQGAEQHTLQPILATLKTRFKKLGSNDNILDEAIITADTGFAAARVAGYAALLRDKSPNLNARQTAGILLETATYDGIIGCTMDNPSANCLQQYGKGRVDITRALAPMGGLQ